MGARSTVGGDHGIQGQFRRRFRGLERASDRGNDVDKAMLALEEVHPQSVVHSMVEFVDGSIKAQLGVPDMHLPIAIALSFPDRLEGVAAPRLRAGPEN